MLKHNEESFTPGVFTKCAAAIESCYLLEQLVVANKLVENNYSNLTSVQYMTLKNRIVRHPCAKGLVLTPAHSEPCLFVKMHTLVILGLFGVACWVTLAWWFL